MLEMDTVTRVQILDEAVCISLSTNILIFAHRFIGYWSVQFLRRALHLCIFGSLVILHSSAQPTAGSIYIVIHWQTVSLYHNSSVWPDMQDASIWKRNPADFTSVEHLTLELSSCQHKQRNFLVYIHI